MTIDRPQHYDTPADVQCLLYRLAHLRLQALETSARPSSHLLNLQRLGRGARGTGNNIAKETLYFEFAPSATTCKVALLEGNGGPLSIALLLPQIQFFLRLLSP